MNVEFNEIPDWVCWIAGITYIADAHGDKMAG